MQNRLEMSFQYFGLFFHEPVKSIVAPFHWYELTVSLYSVNYSLANCWQSNLIETFSRLICISPLCRSQMICYCTDCTTYSVRTQRGKVPFISECENNPSCTFVVLLGMARLKLSMSPMIPKPFLGTKRIILIEFDQNDPWFKGWFVHWCTTHCHVCLSVSQLRAWPTRVWPTFPLGLVPTILSPLLLLCAEAFQVQLGFFVLGQWSPMCAEETYWFCLACVGLFKHKPCVGCSRLPPMSRECSRIEIYSCLFLECETLYYWDLGTWKSPLEYLEFLFPSTIF